jgi:C1A family cysteine protease
MKKNIKRAYGWKPDHLDARDFPYKVKAPQPISTTNNRTTYVMPARFDQQQYGSCTANAWSGVGGYCVLNGHIQNKVSVSPLPFSRFFIYANERIEEGTPLSQDSGAQIRDGIKSIANQGVCPESQWAYTAANFSKKPTPACYKSALQFKGLVYQRLDNTNLTQLVNCLQTGMPFVFGFSVYSSFESATVAKTGIVPMPNIKKEQLLGGHAVWAIDYDMTKKGFWCVNSWGNGWGKDGLFFMPQAYLTNPNLADDFWTLTTIL